MPAPINATAPSATPTNSPSEIPDDELDFGPGGDVTGPNPYKVRTKAASALEMLSTRPMWSSVIPDLALILSPSGVNARSHAESKG